MDTLLTDEGYSAAWTKIDGRNFNARGAQGSQDAAKDRAEQTGIDATLEFPWVSRGSPLVIPSNVATNKPLMLADNYRNLLLFQNNSLATSPDVGANLFISVDGPVQTQQFVNPISLAVSTVAINCITLAPGVGLVLDERVLTNAIYVAWGTSTNTGGTVFTIGMLMYGRSPNSPPYQDVSGYISPGGQGNASFVPPPMMRR